MSMSHLKSLKFVKCPPVISDDHCCISHLKLQGEGGGLLMSRGDYKSEVIFYLLEDEPRTRRWAYN